MRGLLVGVSTTIFVQIIVASGLMISLGPFWSSPGFLQGPDMAPEKNNDAGEVSHSKKAIPEHIFSPVV